MNLCVEIAGAVGVGSSAVLGLWIIRAIFDIYVMCSGVIMLMRLTKSLHDSENESDEINKSEKNQNTGQPSERLGKIRKPYRFGDKLISLEDKSLDCATKQLTKNNMRTTPSPVLHILSSDIAGCEIVKKPLKLGWLHAFYFACRNRCLGFAQMFTMHAHKRPNDPKLSHADGRVAPQSR